MNIYSSKKTQKPMEDAQKNKQLIGGLLRYDKYISFKSDGEGPKIENLGGKGYGLARLKDAGFNVPKFFIITTYSLDMFLDANNTSLDILSAHKGDTANVIMNMKFPDKISTSILNAYKDVFYNEPVAIRSSATIEDTDKNSMAGRFETILNVTEDHILESVKKVYCSLLDVCKDSGTKSSMAVVVQKQIMPQKGGVAFVDKEKTVINAIIGHPALLVSGLESGDTYVVGNDGQYYAVYKPQNTLTLDGNKKEGVPMMVSTRQKIASSEIMDLANTARKIMDAFGKPQDIEWCLSNNEIFILQARPITKQVHVPKKTASTGLLPVSIGIAEGMPWSRTDDIPDKDVILTIPYLELKDTDKLINNPNIKGVITEFGGMLSHESILAREKCIPYLAGFRKPSEAFQNTSHIKLDTKNMSVIADGKEMVTSGTESYTWLNKNLDGLRNVLCKNNDQGLVIKEIDSFVIVYSEIKTHNDMIDAANAISGSIKPKKDQIVVYETVDRTLTSMRKIEINVINNETRINSNLRNMMKSIDEFNVELLEGSYSRSKKDFFTYSDQSIKDYKVYKEDKSNENLKKAFRSALKANGAYKTIRLMSDYYEYALGTFITEKEGRLITDIDLYKLKSKYEKVRPDIKTVDTKLEEIIEDIDRSPYFTDRSEFCQINIAQTLLKDIQKKLTKDEFKRAVLYL